MYPHLKDARRVGEFGFLFVVVAILAACGVGSDGESANANMPATTGILKSLTLNPSASSVVACGTLQFTATGNYSDFTTANVTNLVTWQIDPATTDVALAHSSNGQVIGINAGSGVVYAWAGSIAGSEVVNVSGGNVTALTISPTVATLAAKGSQTFSAIATCTTGSADVSHMNIWSSTNQNAATISTLGVATAIASGSAVIAATTGTFAASAVLNVP
jgi:hypothetical protein